MFILIGEIERELSLHTDGVHFQYPNWLETEVISEAYSGPHKHLR